MLLRIMSPLKSVTVVKIGNILISPHSWLHPEVIMNRTRGRDIFTKTQISKMKMKGFFF
jgi:hypothetical protein